MRRTAWAILLLAAAPEGVRAVPPWVDAAIARAVPSKKDWVVLDDSCVASYDDSGHVRLARRWVARLQNENGRPAASFFLDYDADESPVLAATAWVIDAKGRSRTHRRDEFLDISTDPPRIYWTRSRRFYIALGSRMMPGDTAAVEIVRDMTGPFDIQDSFAAGDNVEHYALEVAPPPGDSLVWHASSPAIPNPLGGEAPGSLRWELSVPTDGLAEGFPSHFLRNPRQILVRRTHGPISGDWAADSALAHSIIGPRMVEAADITARARALTAGKTSRWARIRALCAFVQKDIVYLAMKEATDSFAGMRPHLPSDVAANLCGDCKDKATLLVTMLRAVGEDGRVLLVYSGDPMMIDPKWPTLDFNHAIVAIAAGDAPADWPGIVAEPMGRMIVFDPTDTLAPLGILPVQDQGGWSLLVDAQHGQLQRLPAMESAPAIADTRATAALDANGAMTASVDRDFRGIQAVGAYKRRYHMRQSDFEADLLRGLRALVRQPENLAWTDRWTPETDTYHLHLDYAAFAGQFVGAALMTVSPQLARGVPEMNVWTTTDEGTAFLPGEGYRCHTQMKLPAGWVVEETPNDWLRHGKSIDCEVHYRCADGKLDYTSSFSIRPGFYDREAYEKVRLFLQKVTEAESRPVVLRRASASL